LVDNVVMYYNEKDKIRKHSFVVNLVCSWRCCMGRCLALEGDVGYLLVENLLLNLAVLLAMVWNFIVRKFVKSSIGKIIRLHAHSSGRTLVDNGVMYYDEKDKIRKHFFVVNLVCSWRPIYHDGHDVRTKRSLWFKD